MKKAYKTPVADLLRFDYKDTVTASDEGDDASHCTFGRQPGGCAPGNYGQCKEYYSSNPGRCKNN